MLVKYPAEIPTSNSSAVTAGGVVFHQKTSLRAPVLPIRYKSGMCCADQSSAKTEQHEGDAAPLTHLSVLWQNLEKSYDRLIMFTEDRETYRIPSLCSCAAYVEKNTKSWENCTRKDHNYRIIPLDLRKICSFNRTLGRGLS